VDYNKIVVYATKAGHELVQRCDEDLYYKRRGYAQGL